MDIAEVRRLPSNITAQQLDAMLSDDADTFEKLVAAEALFAVPYGVTAWLRSDPNLVDWVNTLTIKTVEHQILHWRTRRGVDSRPVAKAAHRLARFRSRLTDAVELMHAITDTRRQSVPVSQAMNRLASAHSAEFAEILAGFKERHGGAWSVEPDGAAARLLAMSDEEFAAAVRDDMEELGDARDQEALAHPAVSTRWRDTLIAMGDLTLDRLGLDAEAAEAGSRLPYLIRDQHLPEAPTVAEEGRWIRRLLFLSHLQARLTECRAVRRDYARQVGSVIYEPAEQELRRRHFVEYARLRIEEEQKELAKPPPSTLGPSRFDEFAAALRECGWDVTATLVEPCAWLEARRGNDWISVRSRRRSGTTTGWRPARYFVRQRQRGLWHKMDRFEDVLALARLNAPDHLAAVTRLPSRRIVDPTFYFVAPRYAPQGAAS